MLTQFEQGSLLSVFVALASLPEKNFEQNFKEFQRIPRGKKDVLEFHQVLSRGWGGALEVA